jgi:hypothetical protein
MHNWPKACNITQHPAATQCPNPAKKKYCCIQKYFVVFKSIQTEKVECKKVKLWVMCWWRSITLLISHEIVKCFKSLTIVQKNHKWYQKKAKPDISVGSAHETNNRAVFWTKQLPFNHFLHNH